MIRWLSIFAVALCLISSLTEASFPSHTLSDATLRDAVQTLTHASSRAPRSSQFLTEKTDAAGRLVEYTGLRQTNLWTDLPPLPSRGLNLAYDGLGARTVRTDELVTRRMVVDRVGRLRVPLVETDSGNTAIRYYIWAPGVGLLAQIEADGTIHYFHADENGSTLALTDSNGNVSDQFAYSPWGELLGRTGTNTTLFTFVGGGGVTWEGGALYKMGARYYDARLKRWLSSDPIGMAGGANLYAYCTGNPVTS